MLMVVWYDDQLRPYAQHQAGVVSRGQILNSGITDDAISAQLDARRWQRVHPGVYALFTGPLPERARISAALLWAGEGAALADVTALKEYGFTTTERSAQIHVRVDHDRRVLSPADIVLRRRRRLDQYVHPARHPRVLRLEDAALHAASDRERIHSGLGLLADLCAQRLTTPDRLRATLADLPKLPSRRVFWAALDDIANGAHSFLELSYLRQVEQAHNLPTPRRQAAGANRGRRIWRDAEYDAWGVVLELDGRLGHEDAASKAGDRRRDLVAAAGGKLTIRNGYGDVMDEACDTAALIACVLQARGWSGQPIGCGDHCDLAARMTLIRPGTLGLAS